MKTIQEMINIMLAYERGEKVGVINKSGIWEYIDKPIWNWGIFDYCVRPNQNYVPFETAEEFFNAQREHGVLIFNVKSKTICTSFINDAGLVCIMSEDSFKTYSLRDIFENYKFFDDDTPCGKKVEL